VLKLLQELSTRAEMLGQKRTACGRMGPLS
jgi:hypothetical protein